MISNRWKYKGGNLKFHSVFDDFGYGYIDPPLPFHCCSIPCAGKC